MQEESEWNSKKASSNIKKHGISFDEANAVPDDKIDFSELPPITDFSGFKPLQPEYFKPKREQVSIRMNKILVDHFRSTGKGWQSRVNDFLMKAVANGQI